VVGGDRYAKDPDCSRRGSKHQCGGNRDLEQGGSLVGLGARRCGWRSHSRCHRRQRNRVTAVLPVWLLRILRIRTKSILRTRARLPPCVERLQLGTRLLVMNYAVVRTALGVTGDWGCVATWAASYVSACVAVAARSSKPRTRFLRPLVRVLPYPKEK
jgi:hypothetical protein